MKPLIQFKEYHPWWLTPKGQVQTHCIIIDNGKKVYFKEFFSREELDNFKRGLGLNDK